MNYDLVEHASRLLVDVKELIKAVETEQKQPISGSKDDEYQRKLDTVEFKLSVAYAALREVHESLSGI